MHHTDTNFDPSECTNFDPMGVPISYLALVGTVGRGYTISSAKCLYFQRKSRSNRNSLFALYEMTLVALGSTRSSQPAHQRAATFEARNDFAEIASIQ